MFSRFEARIIWIIDSVFNLYRSALIKVLPIPCGPKGHIPANDNIRFARETTKSPGNIFKK